MKAHFHKRAARGGKALFGIVKRHPDGFGFLIPDDPEEPDVYIPRNSMSGVMSNDRLKIKAEREGNSDRWRGEVEEILQRGTTRVTGKFHSLTPGKGILHDKGLAWGSDLIIENPDNIPVKEGEWISVQITEYPDSTKGFRGKIIKVIGDIMDPLNDAPRILHMQHIPDQFSPKALSEAEKFGSEVSTKDCTGRKDLRGLPLITIDGKTAKDFDDAIFVEKTRDGFRLVVAIADVSHYVRPNMAIDDEAYQRGTSTYFPNFVNPMLPKALSDHLCSLKPKVDRLCVVADMLFNYNGEKTHSEFYEAVMCSQARVTYGEAQDCIEGRVPEAHAHVRDVILRAADLAKILMNKRFREGSLDLEIPETEIECDETGQPVDIMQSERLFSHKLIEEMMLAANVAVAEFINEHQRPVLYRIHDQPDADAVVMLEKFLHSLGFNKKLKGGKLQKQITQALEQFGDHPQRQILHILALRSMAQAKYSTENIGHFGLGFSNYAHFTSPIRRYPDLIVHRVLKSILIPEKGYSHLGEDELSTAGVMLSACEQRSVKAERQIHAIKKARFMQQHLGQEFQGIISSVAKFGVFVLLRQFDVDGLIRLEDLGGDRFVFDEEQLKLIGKKSGMSYAIGDSVHVQVVAAHIEEGKIDFILADKGVERGAFQKEVQSPAQRRSPKGHSQHSGPLRFSKRGRKGKTR